MADLRALLEAATRRPWIDDGYRVRGASDDADPRNGPLVYEYKHAGENGEANAALTVATVNALPSVLDRAERMEAELRDLGQRAETAQCALVDEQIAASEARRLALANDRLRQVAEGERDLLRVQAADATARAERAEAMLNAVRRDTECQADEPPPGAVRRKIRMLARAEARIAEMEAIIEGRTVPPTDAEIEAHYAAGGRWCIADGAGAGDVRRVMSTVREIAGWHRERGATWRWIALDANRRPCAWPAEVSRG